MKPWISIGIFLFLLCSSALSSIGCYRFTEELIRADLNQALQETLMLKRNAWLRTDTIKAYRQLARNNRSKAYLLVNSPDFSQRISHRQLQDKAYLAISVAENGTPTRSQNRLQGPARICGDTMLLSPAQGLTLSACGLAECSMLTILRLSDQRLPLALAVASLGWLLFVGLWNRKHASAPSQDAMTWVGHLAYQPQTGTFRHRGQAELLLTPMQHRLMQLFFASENHMLRKEEICHALWPKKPDASDTLYTLVKRLKCVLREKTNLDITARPGQGYQLTERH